MRKRQLMLKQLDQQLKFWQQTRLWFQPPIGWVRTLRKALGMTIIQLANRLHVHPSRVVKIERAEREDAITLHTLREVAENLNCDLIYAFVPKVPLSAQLYQQAKKVAELRLRRTAHSMLLEDQSVTLSDQQTQLKELIESLLEDNPKYLWEEK